MTKPAVWSYAGVTVATENPSVVLTAPWMMITRARVLFLLLCCLACERTATRQSSAATDSAAIGNKPGGAAEGFAVADPGFDDYRMPTPDSSQGSWGGDKFFTASHVRHPSGLLVMWFDTAIRATEDHPVLRAHADSVVVEGLQPGEFLGRYCMMGGSTQTQVVGIVRDTSEKLTRPRLAWLFDNTTFRIKPMPTDSLTCMLHEPSDVDD